MDSKYFEKLESIIKTAYKQESADDACRLNDKDIAQWYHARNIDVNFYRALTAVNTVYFGIYKTSELESSL